MAQLIFECTKINKLAACSFGKLQQDVVIMENEIIAFEENEKSRLSKDMEKKKITIAQDETEQKGKPILVAIEPVSDFILAEKCSDKRDTESWAKAIEDGVADLNIEIIQSTSDQGSAIKKYRETYLEGASHSPDLFHIQNEIHKATAGPLSSKRRKYEKELAKVQQRLSVEIQKQKKLEGKSKAKSLDSKISKSEKAILKHETTVKSIQTQLEKISCWKGKISQAIATISQIYHPYDITSGQVHTLEQISDCLESQFSEIAAVATEMGLSQKSLKRIEKAHKMVPQMIMALAFYFNTIDAMVEEQTVSTDVENLIKSKLIPIEYLKSVAEKMQKAEDKHAVRAAHKNITDGLENNLTWQSLNSDEQQRLVKLAKECADVFQRSSSCVEGRNSHLGLWYHGVNHLSERKQKSIRIVKNYFIKRSDNTTAAERFFGKPPIDLFLYLVEKLVD